jgi:predicted amidohydrolase YtcJ
MGIRTRTVLALLMVFSLDVQSGDDAERQVFVDGLIYSMDDVATRHTAMVIEGNRIVYLGDDSGAMAWARDQSDVLSLDGKSVFPGFIDTHIHIMDTLPLMDGAMLSPSQSADEVLASLKQHVLNNPDQNPVLGAGFLARAFGINGPTAAQLDEIVSDKPALIIDEGGHTAWVNSKALAMAGISQSTPDPVPGAHFFQRDEEGVPTGWLVEGAAIDPVATALNLVSKEVLQTKAPDFFEKMSAVGLTAAFDAGMIDTEEVGREVALALAQEQRLPVRVVASLYVNRPSGLIDSVENLRELNKRYDHPFFEVNTLKLSLDGTVEAKTAVTLEPYSIPEGHRATPLLPPSEMTGTVIEAAGRNIDLHLHAIGDGAVRTALDAIEAARTTHPDTLSRFTICHIEVVDSQDIPRFAALNVVGQTTPTWFEYDYLALEYLGRARFRQLYPIASIRRQGAKITLGSDYPVTWIGEDALNPMFNIEMAVTRQQAGNRDYPIQAKISERLSVDQAIRAHTIDAAWQLGLEDDIGSLELNKLADFVILDEDPYAVPIYDLHRIQVNRTYSDGRLVYERRP